MDKSHRTNKKGFTLVELLIVVVIVSILAAILLPRFVNQGEKARMAEAGNTIGVLGRAVSNYAMQEGNATAWLAVEDSVNWPLLGIQDPNPNPGTGSWSYSSGGSPGIVRALRTANNHPPTTCSGGHSLWLTLATGIYGGDGCYGASQTYDANKILKP